MIYLLLSIISSSLIFIIFKWIGKLQMNTLLIIVMNYFFAALTGIIITGSNFFSDMLNATWLIYAVLLGSGFVTIFYTMAVTTHRSGAASAVVATKMSVVIPILMAFLFLSDEVSVLKILGILLALLGIFLATRKEEKSGIWNKNVLLLLILFFGSGFIDSAIKLIEKFYLSDADIVMFTSTLFLTAFLTGVIIVAVKAKKHIATFQLNKVWMALLLGLINFASIYFLVQALKTDGMESSILFPLNNIGVVVLSTLLSVLLFKESLSRINISGVVVSIVALIVLMFAV